MKKKLFEIPIYSMNENKFFIKWEKHFEEKWNKFKYYNPNIDKNDYIENLKEFVRPQLTWQYNQIVGYIEIYYNFQDIYFQVYYPKVSKIVFNSKQKHFIKGEIQVGYHFNINPFKTNKEVIEEIDRWLKMIKRDDIPNGRYLDLELYNLYKDKIDYIGLLTNQ